MSQLSRSFCSSYPISSVWIIVSFSSVSELSDNTCIMLICYSSNFNSFDICYSGKITSIILVAQFLFLLWLWDHVSLWSHDSICHALVMWSSFTMHWLCDHVSPWSHEACCPALATWSCFTLVTWNLLPCACYLIMFHPGHMTLLLCADYVIIFHPDLAHTTPVAMCWLQDHVSPCAGYLIMFHTGHTTPVAMHWPITWSCFTLVTRLVLPSAGYVIMFYTGHKTRVAMHWSRDHVSHWSHDSCCHALVTWSCFTLVTWLLLPCAGHVIMFHTGHMTSMAIHWLRDHVLCFINLFCPCRMALLPYSGSIITFYPGHMTLYCSCCKHDIVY